MKRKPNAVRMNHMKCPKCGEILFFERDSQNMDLLPTCGCGYKAGLAEKFKQMSKGANR